MPEPTCDQLFNEEGYEQVDTLLTPWRHGTFQICAFRDEADGTYWKAKFRVSSDGETHELRDGTASISQCWPREVTITVYDDKPPA